MRALVWHGPERMSVDDVPDPAPAAGEVLLIPEAVGICGSEVEGYLGHQANRTPPLIMGHELAGRVAAAGDEAAEDWVGRRAAVNPLLADPGARPGLDNLGAAARAHRHPPARRLRGRGARAGRPAASAARRRRPARRRARRAAGQRRPRRADRPGRRGGRRVGRRRRRRRRHDRADGRAGAAAGRDRLGRRARAAPRAPRGGRRRSASTRRGAAGRRRSRPCATRRAARAPTWSSTPSAPTDTRRLAVELVRPGGCAVMLGLATTRRRWTSIGIVRGGDHRARLLRLHREEYDVGLACLLDGRAGWATSSRSLPLDEGPAAFASWPPAPGRPREDLPRPDPR